MLEATTGSEPAPASELDLPGRYEPLGRLGKGGGGEVWAVRDRHSGARYALKALDPNASEGEMAALVREAAALSGLEGLGVPRVIRFGRLPRSRRAFLVRELVEGKSLDQLIGEGTRQREALAGLVSAIDQLTVLHRAGLLHGDVKPANIIVQADGSGTFVDLGLAAPLREGGASAAGLTPHYAAPELLQGRPLTVRAEVYALGVTLDEALKQARKTELSGSAQSELESIARRATSQQPAERFPSVDEMASAIRRAAALPERDEGGDVALWPITGIDAISGQVLDATRKLAPGEVLSLSGPPGAGRTALLRRLAWSLGVEGEPVALLEGEATGPALVNELEAYATLKGVFVLVDDADALPADALKILNHALREKPRLVAVNAGAVRAPTLEIAIPPLEQHFLRELLRRAIPSLGDAQLRRLLELSQGRPGELRRLVRLIASEAVASTHDVDRVIAGADSEERIPERALDRALYFLDRGRYNEVAAALSLVAASEAGSVAVAIAHARLELGLGDVAGALARLSPLVTPGVLETPEGEELLLYTGRAQLGVGDTSKAIELLEPLSRRAGARGVEALAFHGLCLSRLGRHEEALAELERAVASAAETRLPRVEAVTLSSLGFALQRADRGDEARAVYERAITASERASDAGSLAVIRTNLAGLLKIRGDIAGAITQYEAALDLGRRSGRRQTARQALLNLANLDLYLGRLSRAETRIEALEEQSAQLPPELRAQLSGLRAELHARNGQLDVSVRHYQACAAAFDALGRGTDAAEARLEAVLAEVRLPHPNVAHLNELLERSRKDLGDTQAHRPLSLLAESRVLHAAGDDAAAKHSVDAALRAANDCGQKEWAWRALEARAELAEQAGQPLLARRDREEALAVLEEIGARLPRDLREVYWNDPRRAALRSGISGAVATAATEFLPFTPGLSAATGRGPSKVLSATTGSISQSSVTPLERRLARILEINSELAGELEVERLTQRIIGHAVELTRAERGYVVLQNEDAGLTVYAARARGGDVPAEEFSRSIAESVIEAREPVLALNAQSDSRMAGYASVHQMSLESVACVPILAPRGNAIGALYVETRHRPGVQFERELPTLLAFADQVAIALENARLIRENQRRADELGESNARLEEAQQRLRELLGGRTEQLKRARRKLRDVRETLYGHFGYHGLVGTSAAMRRVYALIDRVKDAEVPVLITGESGTGKEMAARAIHAASPRADKKMLGVNCGAIPDNLLESELFGHVRGAFTGADRERKGLFRECDGGTILLDEIGETPAKMQAGLLRILQDGMVRPVGGTQEQSVDVRMIFATNRDLEEMVRSGKFREDLYYRIHVVELRLPSLRERVEDIPQLVDHFLGLFAARYRRDKRSVSREGLRLLADYAWPGNVRQLEHVLLNAWVMSEDEELEPRDFDLPGARNAGEGSEPRSSPSAPARDSTDKRTLSEHHRSERDRIIEALRECNWNRVKAAELSGIPRRTFYRRLKEYGIQ